MSETPTLGSSPSSGFESVPMATLPDKPEAPLYVWTSLCLDIWFVQYIIIRVREHSHHVHSSKLTVSHEQDSNPRPSILFRRLDDALK